MPSDSRDVEAGPGQSYARAGGDGSTLLADGSEVAKNDSRLTACGDVEEASSVIALALTFGGLPGDMVAMLDRIQNELFDVRADLQSPPGTEPGKAVRLGKDDVAALDQACDQLGAGLPPLHGIPLPGGPPGSVLLYLVRSITRRAERHAWAAVRENAGVVSPWPARYLNRLSDLLLILARQASAGTGDVLWQPGKHN